MGYKILVNNVNRCIWWGRVLVMGKWLKMVQKSEDEGGENMVGKNKIGEQGRCKKEGNECI